MPPRFRDVETRAYLIHSILELQLRRRSAAAARRAVESFPVTCDAHSHPFLWGTSITASAEQMQWDSLQLPNIAEALV